MTRNILNEGRIFINTITGGSAINISSTNSTSSTCNLKISKQTANNTIADTDLFVLETAAGDIRKITGSNMKSELEQSTVVEPLLLTGNAISIKGLSGFTANKILKVNSAGDAIEYGDDNNTEYTAGTNLNLSGTEFNLDTTLTGNITFESTAIFSNLIEVKSSSSGGAIRLFELATNGTDKIILKAPDSLSQDYTITLPADTGTICLDTGSSNIDTVGTITTGTWNGNRLGKSYVPTDTVYDADISSFITASSTDTLTNKTFGDFTTFNDGLGIRYDSFSGVSGFLRLYDDDASNFIDIHPEGHTVASNISVFIPNSQNNTILVGKDTTDILTNKSFNDAPSFNEGLYTKTVSNASSSGFVRFYYNNSTDYLDLHAPATGTSALNVVIPATTGTLLTDADTIPVNKGGTNLTSYTSGDLIYATGASTLSKLAIGSADRFLMSNGSSPVWGVGFSTTQPLEINSMDISIAGLSGFGSNNQIITSTGAGLTYSSTMTSVALSSCTGNISQFTNNSNYVSTTGLTTSLNFGTSAASGVSIGTSSKYLGLIGSEISLNYLTPFTIAITSPIVSSNLISYDSGLTSMVFGEKGGSGYNSALHSNTVLKLSLTNSAYDITMDSTASKITYTAPTNEFAGDVKITGDTISVKQDSKLVNTTNTECFLKFYNTVLENTFHRTDMVKLQIAKNTSYAGGTENGYIVLVENGTTSNTTRLYFNNAGTAYIFYDGTNLINTPSFAPSDKRVKKNETLANTNELSNAFDKIDIYKYQYEEQYALDKGADPNKYVYGFIAQNVKENTDNLSSQFSSTGDGESIYPNEKIEYEGDKLKVEDLITINKTDMNLLLWGKIKEMDAIIKNQQLVINNLLNATTFANFKKL